MNNKEKIDAVLSPRYFTNKPLDNTKKSVVDYGAYGQLGNAISNVGGMIAKGVEDYDNLKLQQFKAVANEKQNTYLQMMQETNSQDERDTLTNNFKNDINKLAEDKKMLNDRQRNIWDSKYKSAYFMTVDEQHNTESFLGTRRNVRAEGVKSAQILADSVTADDDKFAIILSDAQKIKDTLKQYTAQKDFDILDLSITNAIYERKAMADISAGKAAEVAKDMDAGGIKYKVSSENASKISAYANKIYRTQLQNDMAMSAISKSTSISGDTDFVKASNILLNEASAGRVEFEDIQGAIQIISSLQNVSEKNKAILADNSFMTKYNTAVEMKAKGKNNVEILNYIRSYDRYLTPRDEEMLVKLYTDEENTTGTGANKGLGEGYSAILEKVVNKEITSESDPRIYRARLEGGLTERGLNALQSNIKIIQTPETHAVAKDILEKATALYASNTNFFTASEAEKGYIKQRLMDYIGSVDQSTPNGRTEVDKLRDLGYLQSFITKTRAEYDGTMQDTQARIDLQDKYAEVKKTVNNQILELTDKLNAGTLNEKEFTKALESIIKTNQYKKDKDVLEYYNIDEEMKQLTDLYNIKKNSIKQNEKNIPKDIEIKKIKKELVIRAASDVSVPNKAKPKNIGLSLKDPIKAGMGIEELTNAYEKGGLK